MFGLLEWAVPTRGRRAVLLGEREILGPRFLAAEVRRGPHTPEAELCRRVASAGRRLRRAGVSRVVLPESFPYGGILEKYGLAPVDTLPLRRALAADLALAALAERPGGTMAVAADRPGGELTRAVTELCLRCRYVSLDLARGGEELARSLRREYGVSLLLRPDREQLESAGVLVLFDRRAGLPLPGQKAVPLWEGGEDPALPPLLLPPALEAQLPSGCDQPQLLAALRAAGALSSNQITVASRSCLLT